MRDDYARFGQKETEILAVNPAPVDQHKNYSDQFNFPFPLLSDIDKTLCESYGVLKPFIRSVTRTVMIIDKLGIVRSIDRGMPTDEELLIKLDEINQL